jgi:hypothetical protein
MQKITTISVGLWYIEEFLPCDMWKSIENQIMQLDNSVYFDRHEPMRLRAEITSPECSLYQSLISLAVNTVGVVERATNYTNLRNPPGLFLWRDSKGFKSHWHPDDFTTLPTAQIYVDGDKDLGTSFIINGKEITISFEPNTGYLMDNRYQIVHGMLTPVQDKVRQSVYLIY